MHLYELEHWNFVNSILYKYYKVSNSKFLSLFKSFMTYLGPHLNRQAKGLLKISTGDSIENLFPTDAICILQYDIVLLDGISSSLSHGMYF